MRHAFAMPMELCCYGFPIMFRLRLILLRACLANAFARAGSGCICGALLPHSSLQDLAAQARHEGGAVPGAEGRPRVGIIMFAM